MDGCVHLSFSAMCVQVHVTPLASQTKHRSQAGDHAAILSHTLNSHFASGYVLDVGSLCVQEGQHCWDVQVDVCVLNDDGGVLDACTAATTSALRKLKVCPISQLIHIFRNICGSECGLYAAGRHAH